MQMKQSQLMHYFDQRYFMSVSMSSNVGWGEANADGCFIQFTVAIEHHD